ncbi:MAG: Uma2 family endonuclease [Microcoleaceae cyanobacterium]
MTLASSPTTCLKDIVLSPGSHVLIPNVSWEQYETLLVELGNHRTTPRITYFNQTLELMNPLPAHEQPHRIIARIVTELLEAENKDWYDFGSSTLKQSSLAGVEPDTCFYIRNLEQMRNKKRFAPNDPPPDLAIESDVTSKTTLEAYAALQVPEIWIYDAGQLTIWILQNGSYEKSSSSLLFPHFPILEQIPRLIELTLNQGTLQMLKSLRKSLPQARI